MTWGNRLRLLIGLVIVGAIALGATLILSQRETQVASRSASIKAITYNVGTDYAGTVVKQQAASGQSVDKGQPLMTIQSASLLRALKSKAVMAHDSAYRASASGELTLLATQRGVVSKVGAHVGGFVSAGSALETIDRSKSLYVFARFKLDPYDFSRVQKGAEVDLILPNQQRITGTVSRIHVTTVGGKADVSVDVHSSKLKRGTHDGLVVPGTPISAELHLRDDGPLAGLKHSFIALLEQIGL